MQSVLIFYVLVACLFGFNYELMFKDGRLKTVLSDEEIKAIERFITINWESKWWHLYIAFTAIFWFPILLLGPFLIPQGDNKDEE